jgi:DNA-binding winged helix-turn-helix (wHTH) protein
MEKNGKQVYEFGPFRVDSERQILLRDDHPVPLTPKAFETLLVLMRHSHEVVSKDDLMKALWPDTFVEETNLSRNIFMLRKALGETPEDHRYIVTLPGRGYRFAETVRTVPEGGDLVLKSRSRSRVIIEQTEQTGVEVPAIHVTPQSHRHRWVRTLAATVAASLLLISSILILHQRKTISLGETDWFSSRTS